MIAYQRIFEIIFKEIIHFPIPRSNIYLLKNVTCLGQSGFNFSVKFNPFPDIKVTCHILIFSWYLRPHDCFWYHTFSHSRWKHVVNNTDSSELWCTVSVCSADTKGLIGFYCSVWLLQHIRKRYGLSVLPFLSFFFFKQINLCFFFLKCLYCISPIE